MFYCLCCDIIIGPLSGTLQLRKESVFIVNSEIRALNESQQLVTFPLNYKAHTNIYGHFIVSFNFKAAISEM